MTDPTPPQEGDKIRMEAPWGVETVVVEKAEYVRRHDKFIVQAKRTVECKEPWVIFSVDRDKLQRMH